MEYPGISYKRDTITTLENMQGGGGKEEALLERETLEKETDTQMVRDGNRGKEIWLAWAAWQG